MTLAELQKRFPNASSSFLTSNCPVLAAKLPAPKPQQDQRSHKVHRPKGKEESPPSVAVFITRCSTGRLDRDNLYRAAKEIVDALRYAGFIPGDSESDIEHFCFQRKVKRAEIGTLVEILHLAREDVMSLT